MGYLTNLFKKTGKPAILFNLMFDKVILPSKAHTGIFEDAAYDLFPFIPMNESDKNTDSLEEIILFPGERRSIRTGLRAIIPEGYWIKFHERSGLANKGIHVMGGVIDNAYTGEWRVILYNSDTNPITLPVNKAITQFTLEKLTRSEIIEIGDIDFTVASRCMERGEKGFGSSDVKS